MTATTSAGSVNPLWAPADASPEPSTRRSIADIARRTTGRSKKPSPPLSRYPMPASSRAASIRSDWALTRYSTAISAGSVPPCTRSATAAATASASESSSAYSASTGSGPGGRIPRSVSPALRNRPAPAPITAFARSTTCGVER